MEKQHKPITGESRSAQAAVLMPSSLKPILTSSKKAEDLEAAAIEFHDEESCLGQREPVSPTSMIFHDPRVHNTILAVMGSSKRIDVDHAKAAMEATLVRHPRFSSIQEWDLNGKANWVRTKVNVNNHIIVPDLNSISNPSSDLFIEEYLSTLSTSMLDFSKPLWELHILNIPTSTAEATILFRIHHSVGDGISLISLLIDCAKNSSSSSNGTISILPCDIKMETMIKGTSNTLNVSWWKNFLIWFPVTLAMVWNTMVSAFGLLFTSFGWIKDTDTHMKAGKKSTKLNKRKFVSMTISLEDLKIIKHKADATINDVVLGFVSAGLWNYLNRRYDNLGLTIPKNIRIRSAVMVNLRKSTRIQAFPNLMDKSELNSQWGNHISFLLIPLPIVRFDCPLDYVKSAKVIADRKKSSMEARLTYFIGNLLTKFFGSKTVATMFFQVMSNITLLMSNIPGPTEEIEFSGHRMLHPSLTVYGFPQAISIHCLSYMDKMRIYLAVDEDTIPDPQQLCKDLLQSLHNIKYAAMRMEPSM